MISHRTAVLILAGQLLYGGAASAQITNARLEIQGAGLRIEDRSVTTGVDIPITIQTEFGGKKNDEAPSVPGLTAVGDLTGPGIDVPIQLTTTPGFKFNVPGLSRIGDYYLQNVRLMSGADVLQAATPSLVKITVADLLQTSLKVRQLSPEEIRARGIIVDARNYDVYEFSFTFIVDGKEVVVPFPVIIDPRTHTVIPVHEEKDAGLPTPKPNVQPPRWTPPVVIPFEFPDLPQDGGGEPGQDPPEKKVTTKRHRIPAALVIPNSLAVMHQFSGTHYATAVDGEGRALLIDLSRIDERRDVPPMNLLSCGTPCAADLFPTVMKALAAGADPTSPVRFGSDDPRIVWKSNPDLDNFYGTLAPIADPDTGFIFSGDLLEETVHVLSGFDPRITIKAKVDGGPMQPVSAVVPLGIAAPARFGPGALGAFRIEVALPGSIAESLSSPVTMAVESHRVPGAKTEPTPAGWPAAHLDVQLHRVLPSSIPGLRYQKGWNVFVSDPIAVLADPRASKVYEPAWGSASLADKENAGCFACEMPQWAKDDPSTTEIYSLGRSFHIGPAASSFAGRYAYLDQQKRLETTLATVMADTIRPPAVLVAAQNPPIAGGMLQETTYLHSGEVETNAIDLDAGGRVGWNVTLDRTYRSRTIGYTALGMGWDSSMFRRLRLLPTNDVEYRDGGEVWRFKKSGVNYIAPSGLFLKLIRSDRGWALIDQKWRAMTFDDLGRLTSESDEFADPLNPGPGNTIRYFYGADGRLSKIIDPVGRDTTVTFDPPTGLLREIKDWRERVVSYSIPSHLLTAVKLPAAKAAVGVPPEFDHSLSPPIIEYTYDNASAAFNDRLELNTNLKAIKDPVEVASSGPARVSFTYGLPNNPAIRDHVAHQAWATGESATFAYLSASQQAVADDALGQRRTYELTSPLSNDERVHIASVLEHEVPLVDVGGTGIPAAAPVNAPPTPQDLITTFDQYTDEGLVEKVTHPNLLEIESTYEVARNGAPGKILTLIRQSGPGFTPVETRYRFEDQSSRPNAANTIESVGRNEDGALPGFREAQSASRERTETVQVDDDIQRITRWNAFGQVKASEVRDGSNAETQRTSVFYYGAPSLNLLERGRPFHITAGSGDLAQTLTYQSTPFGGERVEMRDMVRGTTTETLFDSYGRQISAIVTSATGQVLADERFGYDRSGRLGYHSRVQTPLGVIETRTVHDAVGREVEGSVTKASVGNSSTTLVEKTVFDLASHKVTRHDPATAGATAAAVQTTTLDRLGRPIRTERTGTPGTSVTRVFGYDFDGQLSYETDTVRTAILHQYDLLGREEATVAADGTSTETSWTSWNEPLVVIGRGSNGAPVGRTKNIFTSKGRLRAVNEELGQFGSARQTRFSWKGGRTTTTRVGLVGSVDEVFLPSGSYRTQQTERDLAGRTLGTKVGEADGQAGLIVTAANTFAESSASFLGSVPTVVTTSEPRLGVSYSTGLSHDGLDRTTEVVEAGGAYVTRTMFDEASNAVEVRQPGMNAQTAAYDGRGLPTVQILPDGKQIRHVYDELGNLRERVDEAGESTFYDTDPLGRVFKVRYADGSFEEIAYEDGTGLTKATRDRAGQWLSYVYDSGGRVTSIRNGPDPTTAPDLVQYHYDPAGRLMLVKNKDAGIGYEGYDFLGRPSVTRVFRYLQGTGLQATPAVLDVHTQTHAWSIHDGERTSWRMPAAGPAAPPPDDPASPWLQTIVEKRDAGMNLIAQEKPAGGPLLEANGRSVGRISTRKRMTTTGGVVESDYGFSDALPIPSDVELPSAGGGTPPPQSGLPLWSRTEIGGITLAGTANARDGARRLGTTRDLGSGGRLSAWNYDDRGRVVDSWVLRPTLLTLPITDTLVDADFRAKRDVPAVLTPVQHDLLGSVALDLEPLTWTQTKKPTLHQADARTVYLDGLPKAVRNYGFDLAGRRSTDGVWTSQFDELGRLTSMTSATLGRRIEFAWDPNDRLVGRTSLMSDGGTGWTIEKRTNVLARDGLPAETTFVWDPTADRLVAIYVQGASTAPGALVEAGLLRQYLHGDQGYDDPTRVLIAPTPGGTPKTYFPILDEAGTGSLVAVVGDDGALNERVHYADSYGDAPRYQHGPIVDRISIEVKKTGTGDLETVNVRVHLSDAITTATLSAGLRLAVLRGDRSVIQTPPSSPTIEDRYTALWTLTATQWNSLVSAVGAEFIEVAIHRDLNAEGWSATPVMPIPAWALLLYPQTDSTSTHPVIVREPITSLTSFIDAIPDGTSQTRKSYEMESLYLASSEDSTTKLLTGFKAAPFVEPATELVLLRDRWYDPSTGTFVTPDPESYQDSSNLYAGFAGDPVNNSDPTGRCAGLDEIDCWDHAKEYSNLWWNPGEWGGTASRSVRFFGYELKGAVLAVPRTAKGIYDVATHLPETVEAVGSLATAISNDWVGMLQSGGNAITNADPNAVAEFVGENLGLAGLGAAAKTPQVANALRGSATAANFARASQRARVLANIAESGAARKASRFRLYGEFDRLYALADVVDVGTEYGRAVFYSGRFPVNKNLATGFALRRGMKTIEMTRGGGYFDALGLYGRTSSVTRSAADAIWDRLSLRYAQGTRGPVTAFVTGAKPTGTFMRVEFPILRSRGWKVIYRGFP